MSVNTATLLTRLATRLESLSGSETSADVLALTAAINNSTQNRFMSVRIYSDLPDLTIYPMPSGTLILVEQFNTFVMAVGNQWVGIDGRIYTPRQILYAWGLNTDTRLGDGTTASARLSPATVIGGITNWSAVAAGNYHSTGVTSSGIAYAWGRNTNGQLGDGTTSTRSSPVTVIGGITNWSQVSAGSLHTLGITATGIAYAWGSSGSFGNLGDGTTSARSSPVTVVGGITNWSQVSAGNDHSLGRTASGIVYGWGRNLEGQVGDNTTTGRASPVTVVGGITNWSQVAAGSFQSLGRTAGGLIYGWGRNPFGELGDNTTSSRSSPVTVVGGITNWSQVSSGLFHGMAITSASIAYAWGRNNYGQLGDNTPTGRSSPVTVVGGITNWSSIFGGSNHSLGIAGSGIAYAWGRGQFGQLGTNNTSSRSSPVTVAGGATNWFRLAGNDHTLGIAIV